MIQILRHVKQKLIAEGKFRKYLAYAIGEILLVMIGILLALAINNWNEKRKLYEAETQYYINLKRQLEEDKKFIESNIAFNDRYRQQYLYALRLLQSNDRSNLDTLGKIAVNLLEYSDFHQQRNIYESLVSSGEINLLHNKAIVEGLQRLDESFVYINKLEEAHFDVIKAIYSDLTKIVRFQPLVVERPDALFDFDFQNHFVLSVEITAEKEEVYKNSIHNMDDILKRIDEELKLQ